MASAEENPRELRLNEALVEYMHQCDSGALPDREAFLRAYPPELRTQLSELLTAADWIEELAGPTIADIASDEGPGKSEATLEVEDTLPHIHPGRRDFSSDTIDGNNLQAQRMERSQPALPCLFGDYLLERVLGRGGMGVVYYGRQLKLDRPVAIKMIRSGALASEEEVERFYAEARSAAQLHHPNIVTVYQCGEQDGHRFFSMDYVDGTDLAQMTELKPIDARLAARYVRDVARAIQYAHDRGILHRDLKPANILVDQNGTVRITDFGLAKSVGAETGLTATGAALGTPSYMSPEQATGSSHEQHHATDIYSLGAILFRLVTGRPPFKGSTVLQTIMHVIHRPAPMARSLNPNVDHDLETIIDVCLQKAPERRYSSAAALADDLDRYLQGIPIQARPMSQVRRAWYWLLGVPIFGAVLDHRVVEPTDAHRWFQRGLISIALLMAAAWVTLMIPSRIFKNRMPKTVRIAGGLSGGSYDALAQSICAALGDRTQCEALSLSTSGSQDNVDRLTKGEVDLALVQADALDDPHVAVIAPLYFEAVHLLVRKGVGIETVEDFRGHSVNVGMEKAGSRGIAELVLRAAGLGFQDIVLDSSDWHLLLDPSMDSGRESKTNAAIVVSRLGSPDVHRLLANGQFKLIPLPDALDFQLKEPAFHFLMIEPGDYEGCSIPEDGIDTVGVAAYLAATRDTPEILVEAVLENLFAPEMRSMGIFSAVEASHWQEPDWHPAAIAFFAPYRGIKL